MLDLIVAYSLIVEEPNRGHKIDVPTVSNTEILANINQACKNKMKGTVITGKQTGRKAERRQEEK